MKSKGSLIALLMVLMIVVTSLSFAAPKPPKATASPNVPRFPGTLVNARYVYVTSYEGNQFDINLLPEDRAAVSAVQGAIQKWGKFIVVYEPQQADVVIMVTNRASEDILAVYDAHGWPRDQYLWRMMSRNGLQQSETPLVTNLEKAFERATGK